MTRASGPSNGPHTGRASFRHASRGRKCSVSGHGAGAPSNGRSGIRAFGRARSEALVEGDARGARAKRVARQRPASARREGRPRRAGPTASQPSRSASSRRPCPQRESCCRCARPRRAAARPCDGGHANPGTWRAPSAPLCHGPSSQLCQHSRIAFREAIFTLGRSTESTIASRPFCLRALVMAT